MSQKGKERRGASRVGTEFKGTRMGIKRCCSFISSREGAGCYYPRARGVSLVSFGNPRFRRIRSSNCSGVHQGQLRWFLVGLWVVREGEGHWGGTLRQTWELNCSHKCVNHTLLRAYKLYCSIRLSWYSPTAKAGISDGFKSFCNKLNIDVEPRNRSDSLKFSKRMLALIFNNESFAQPCLFNMI